VITVFIFATVLGKRGFILNFPPALRTTASSAMIVLARMSAFIRVFLLLIPRRIFVTDLNPSCRAHFESCLHPPRQ
jgi:hypothetical protein